MVALRQVFSIDGLEASSTHYVAVPGSELASVADLRTVADLLLLALVEFATAITHAGASTARVACRRWGASPLNFDLVPAPNVGAWTGGQLATGCTIVEWLTGEGGRGRNGHTFVPGFPDDFTDDHANINETGWGNAIVAARTLLTAINATPGVSGGDCVHGIVHRSAGGVPLDAATFTPTLAAVIGMSVGTIDRRRPAAR